MALVKSGNGAVEFRRLEMRGPPLDVGGGIIGVGNNRLGVRDGTLNLLLFVPIRPCLCYGPPNQSKPWKTYHWGHSQQTNRTGMIAEVCRYGLIGTTDLENVHNELRFHIEHKEHYFRLYEQNTRLPTQLSARCGTD